MKRLFAILTVLAVGVAVSTPAFGSVFNYGENQGFFENVEAIFHADGTQFDPFTTAAVPGDVIVGIFDVQNVKVDGNPSHWRTGVNGLLSGIFVQEIKAIFPPPDPFDATQTDDPHVVFGPAPVGFTTISPTTGAAVDLRGTDGFFGTADDVIDLSAGELFRFYLQGVAGSLYETNGPISNDIGKVTDGSVFWSLTYSPGADGLFGGDDGAGGFKLPTDDTGLLYSHVPSAPTTNSDGEGFGALDSVINNTGVSVFLPLDDPNENELGSVIAGGAYVGNDMYFNVELTVYPDSKNAGFGNHPWDFASNDPFHVNAVPEPASLAIWGLLGLVGVGYVLRRRRR